MNIESSTSLPVDEVSLACFETNGRSYALDVGLVREIVRPQEITPLPNAPTLIDGVVELRGGLIPVLDLARVLGGEPSDVSNQSRVVVLDSDGMVIGLCVDSATDVLSVDASLLEDVPDLATQTGYNFVRWVVRRPDEPPVMVLAFEAIMENVYRSARPNVGEN